MDEREIRELIGDVKTGRLSRRAFVHSMVGLGLTAPMAASVLAAAGAARAQTRPAFTPARRGGGGQLKVLWWQAPTLLNPHFATGTKDQELKRLEQGGKGRAEIFPGSNPEHIQCNFTDPGKEIDGERSSAKAQHPLNKWAGRNITRWRNDEYDRLWKAAENELDPAKRAAMFVKMNDLVISNVVVIPVLWRNGVSAVGTRLRGMELSTWDSNLWHLPYWYKA